MRTTLTTRPRLPRRASLLQIHQKKSPRSDQHPSWMELPRAHLWQMEKRRKRRRRESPRLRFLFGSGCGRVVGGQALSCITSPGWDYLIVHGHCMHVSSHCNKTICVVGSFQNTPLCISRINLHPRIQRCYSIYHYAKHSRIL